MFEETRQLFNDRKRFVAEVVMTVKRMRGKLGWKIATMRGSFQLWVTTSCMTNFKNSKPLLPPQRYPFIFQ